MCTKPVKDDQSIKLLVAKANKQYYYTTLSSFQNLTLFIQQNVLVSVVTFQKYVAI